MHWLLSYPKNGPSVDFYCRWLKASGVEAVLLDSDYAHPGEVGSFDALLLPGGGDVDPARYGEQNHVQVDGVSEARDEVELQLIAEFRAMRRPVFGICRGIQILNVALGGGLVQHVPDVVAESVELHRRVEDCDTQHPIRFLAETRLGAALASARDVNSAHHQAVNPDRVGAGLTIAAWSGQGIVEAVESVNPEDRISAVQWHPERMASEHPASRMLREYWCRIASER